MIDLSYWNGRSTLLSSRRWGFVNTHVFAVIYSLSQSSLSLSLCWAHFDFIKMWCVFAFLGLSLFFSLKSRMQITGIIPKFAGFEIPSKPFQMQPFFPGTRSKFPNRNFELVLQSIRNKNILTCGCPKCSDLINELNEFACMASRGTACWFFSSLLFSDDTYFFHFRQFFRSSLLSVIFFLFFVCLSTVDKIDNYKRFVAFGLFVDGSTAYLNIWIEFVGFASISFSSSSLSI